MNNFDTRMKRLRINQSRSYGEAREHALLHDKLDLITDVLMDIQETDSPRRSPTVEEVSDVDLLGCECYGCMKYGPRCHGLTWQMDVFIYDQYRLYGAVAQTHDGRDDDRSDSGNPLSGIKEQLESLLEVLESGDLETARVWTRAALKKLDS